MELHCEKYIRYGEMNWDFLPKDKPVLVHGSIGLIKDILRKGKDLYPCIWCDFEILSCHSYYSYWGEYLLQRKYAFYPLAEIVRLKDYLYGDDDDLFIRPDANNKEFTGEVIKKKEFDIWWKKINYDNTPPTTMCIVAKPEKILAEYRLIMAKGKVVIGSKYRNNNIICYDAYYPKEIEGFAEEVCKKWQPHPIFCLDLAETPDGCKVVECGSVNCAGYYSADLRKIVQAMSDLAEEEYNELQP